MKRKRTAVSAALGLVGLATLPFAGAAHASTPTTTQPPSGLATAQALSLQVSLAPVQTAIGGVVAQVKSVEDAVCATAQSLPSPQTLGCDHPISSALSKQLSAVPADLKLTVAQATSNGTLTTAEDLTNGHAASSVVTTDFDLLTMQLAQVQSLVDNLLATISSTVQPVTAVTGNPVSVSSVDIFGAVSADFPGAGPFSTTLHALQVQGLANPSTAGVVADVDPFSATATDAAHAASVGAAGPLVEAKNATSRIGLPVLKTGLDPLKNAISQVQGVITTIHDTVAGLINQANTTVGGAVSSAAPTLAPVVGTLIGAANTVNDTAASTLVSTLDTVSGQLDQVSAPLKALEASLPDLGNLVTIAQALASSKVDPVSGGIEAEGSTYVGNLQVLPVGTTLAQAINGAGTGLNITDATPLLSIDGITSDSRAIANPLVSVDGSVGLNSISVLGETINLDGSLPNASPLPATPAPTSVALPTASGVPAPGSVTVPPPVSTPNPLGALGPGQEWVIPVNTGVGIVSLDITRGLPQKNVTSDQSFGQVNTATLSIRLVNGNVTCDPTAGCRNPLSLGGSSAAHTNSARTNSASTGGSSGISQLGNDGDVLAAANIGQTSAEVGQFIVNGGGCTSGPCCPAGTNCAPGGHCSPGVNPACSAVQETAASLPSTGMFGSAALPAGIGLIVVAIVLRLAPSLRPRSIRVR